MQTRSKKRAVTDTASSEKKTVQFLSKMAPIKRKHSKVSSFTFITKEKIEKITVFLARSISIVSIITLLSRMKNISKKIFVISQKQKTDVVHEMRSRSKKRDVMDETSSDKENTCAADSRGKKSSQDDIRNMLMRYQSFNIGDILWAKMRGFPLWPCKVCNMTIMIFL